MVKDIVKGKQIFKKAQKATIEDASIIQDLLDTLQANRSTCVGMAANMIGVNRTIIAIVNGPFLFVMVNPVITKKSGKYITQESCLSLEGKRSCIRYKEIEVEYFDENFEKKKGTYNGFLAQIIQHEIDHCNGIII